MLSRRALVFVNNEFHYICRRNHFSEGIVDPSLKDILAHGSSGSLLPEVAALDFPCNDYETMLMYYTQRALSEQNDALLAMAGIARRVSQKMKCSFFQGVPTAAFDAFVAFSGHRSILRRRKQFPSYTWAGWIGEVDGDTAVEATKMNDWLRNRTWIIWYKRSPAGIVNPVWDIMANEEFPVNNSDYVGYRTRSQFGSRYDVNSTRTWPTETLQFERYLPDYPVLQFWTLAVWLSMNDFEVFTAMATIVDRVGNKCGYLQMDGFEDDEFFQPNARYEFIIISESYSRDYDCSCRRSSYDPKPILYNALVLEWSGGIAERRGFGILCHCALGRAHLPSPWWKEILLA